MPYKTLPIDLNKWEATWGVMAGEPYVWGGKAAVLAESPPRWQDEVNGNVPCLGPDCSGAMRYAIYHATFGKVDIGDGSYSQGEKLAALELKSTHPTNCALEDGHLRICIHHPDELDRTGHIWAVRCGITSESFGGHGPGHRVWNARLGSGHRLNELATLCFVAT